MKYGRKENPDVFLETMSLCQIDQVVDIHLQAFPDFFLTFLGGNFLKIYYKAIINHNNGIKIVIVDDSVVIGFIVGTMHPAGFYSSLIKNDLFLFALASIPAIIRRPRYVPRILRSFAKPTQAYRGNNISELTSLAVLPQYHGKGYGQLLLNEFVNRCKKREGRRITLTTDALCNKKTNTFYTKAGFVLVRSFITPENRQMNEYQYTIS